MVGAIQVDASAVSCVLQQLGADADMVSSALEIVPDRCLGLLVYGSFARGDYLEGSDLDLLSVTEQPCGSRSLGHVNVSFYTPQQLEGARRTLFGMHLARDGRVLHDTQKLLVRSLESMGEPDPDVSLEQIRHLSVIIDVGLRQVAPPLAGLARVARYFLRSAIYLVAIAQGRPCFSVRELAERFGDPALLDILKSRTLKLEEVPSQEEVAQLRVRLREFVGPAPATKYQTIQQMIVAEWDSDRPRATMATLALADSTSELDYAALPKVLL